MSGAYDVKALQARLGNLRDKRDEVERSLSTLRGPPRDQGRYATACTPSHERGCALRSARLVGSSCWWRVSVGQASHLVALPMCV